MAECHLRPACRVETPKNMGEFREGFSVWTGARPTFMPSPPSKPDVGGVFLDLKYAVRSMVVAPGFAAVVIVTTGLGTGANTAVFSVLNAVVLKPLPYDEPERLVRVYHSSG